MSKFKLGDWVRVMSDWSAFKGEVGMVHTTSDHGVLLTGMPDSPDEPIPFGDSELERIGTEFKLSGGDIIRNTRTDKTGVVYTDGDGVLRIRYLEPTLVSDDVKATAVEEYEHHYPGTYEVLFGVSA